MNPKNVLLISFFYQAQSWTSWAGKWGRIKFVCWNTLFEGWRLSIDIGYLSKNCHYFLFEHYLSLSIRLNLELRWSAARRGGQAAHHARHHGRERPLHAAHSPAHQPAHQTRQTLPTTGGLCPFLSHTFLSLFLFLFLSCYYFFVTFYFKQTHSHPLFNPKRYHTTGSFLAEL